MFARRSDLPLDKDALSRFLPWLIAFMVFLAVMAMAGVLVLNTVAARWDRGVSGTLTVQIIPAENAVDDDARLQTVLKILTETPEIERFETLGDVKLAQMRRDDPDLSEESVQELRDRERAALHAHVAADDDGHVVFGPRTSWATATLS